MQELKKNQRTERQSAYDPKYQSYRLAAKDIPAKSASITKLMNLIGVIPNEITKSLYLNELQKRYSIPDGAVNQLLGLESQSDRFNKLEAEMAELKEMVAKLLQKVLLA